jgi:hypothetical protein
MSPAPADEVMEGEEHDCKAGVGLAAGASQITTCEEHQAQEARQTPYKDQ